MSITSTSTDAFNSRQFQLNKVLERVKKENPTIDHDRAWYLAKNKDPEGKRIFDEMTAAGEERKRQAAEVEGFVPSPEMQRSAAIRAETAKLQASGLSYDEAWNLAKNLPEHQR